MGSFRRMLWSAFAALVVLIIVGLVLNLTVVNIERNQEARITEAGDVVAKGAVIAVAGFAAYSLVDHPSNVDRVAIALWIALGLVAGGTPQLRGGRALGARLFRRPVRA